jgi:hypothetical protein
LEKYKQGEKQSIMTTITTEKQQKLNQIIQLINSIYTTKVGKYSNSYKEYYKIYELRDMDILKDLQSFRLDKLDLIIDSLISTQRCISKLKMSGVSLELIFILYKTGSKRIIANINDIHTLNNSTSPFILSCDSINNGCVTFQNLKQFQPSVLQFLDTRNCCLDLTKLNLAVSSRKDIFNMIDLINSQQSINLNNTTLVKTKTHNNRYDLVLYNKQTLDNISSRLKYFCNNSSEELQQFDMNALIKFFKIILLSKLTYEINTNGAMDLSPSNSPNKDQDLIITLITEIENLRLWCEQMRFNVVCYNETHWMGIGLKL